MSDFCEKLLPILLSVTLLGVAGCASLDIPADSCPPDTQALENCPPLDAVDDAQIQRLYEYRTWRKPSEIERDPIKLGKQAEIPERSARVKYIGTSQGDAITSLAAKIWMIENAQHTVDLMYYIFTPDLAGKAMLGALCDAVERGVDVRFMVDSLGSIGLSGSDIKALESCVVDAGFLKTATGSTTIYRARAQTVVFNAISKIFVNWNRRSHDKILVVDGMFADKAAVMTGGRNISLSYYGILADGSHNPDTYNDAEILLRTGKNAADEDFPVGAVADIYYTLLYFFKNNKRVRPTRLGDAELTYKENRQAFRESLAALKALPAMQEKLAQMPDYFSIGFHDAEVRLAHEFGNLVNKRVVTEAMNNLEKNPNSIVYVLREADDRDISRARLVSPYLFLARYEDKEGNVVHDDAANILSWLKRDPHYEVEIITNSVLTSDNVGAQAVIDMDTAPRLLLTEDMQARWLEKSDLSELNAELMSSEEWQEMISHPRLRVYETGRLDDVLLGGGTDYGKLHAKFIVVDDTGFVGTANFDYRSRLFNNEMGFFFESPGLAEDMNDDFDSLVEKSYLWGSPEWLEMRRQTGELPGMKGYSVRNQRSLYKTLKATGLLWLF